MIGAIAGDIIGSVYESDPIKTKHFPLFHERAHFTDDSVLTIAVAMAVMEDRDYRRWIVQIGRRYPFAGYGGSFLRWLHSDTPRPYGSWGNGSAMRVSPIGFAFDTVDTVLLEAARSAEISHNHPEGIRGAQAAALAVFLARTEHDKDLIKKEVAAHFGYDLDRSVEAVRPSYRFDISCQGTVPEALIAFLDSDSYEDAVRNAVSLGGDSDTLACITGAVAEAYYGSVDESVRNKVRESLPAYLWSIAERFCSIYGPWTGES